MTKSILVIEDDLNIITNIKALLEEEGYFVLTASNGDDGIKSAKNNLPDLIICDILMPRCSGYDVLNELSLLPSTRSIPFIFLTAMADKDDIRKGMQLGVDDYLPKPFKTDDLLKSIETRLRRKEVFKSEPEKNIGQPEVKEFNIDDKIFMNVNGIPLLLNIKEIVFISAENQYSSVSTESGKNYLVRKSVSLWEEQLPQRNFLRIHRAVIVNMNYIERIEKWYNSSLLIYLRNFEKPFTVSKRYSAKLRKNIS